MKLQGAAVLAAWAYLRLCRRIGWDPVAVLDVVRAELDRSGAWDFNAEGSDVDKPDSV